MTASRSRLWHGSPSARYPSEVNKLAAVPLQALDELLVEQDVGLLLSHASRATTVAHTHLRRTVPDVRSGARCRRADGRSWPTRQKAGRLSGWRICSGSTHLLEAHPIVNGSPKDIDVYACEVSELDAIARNTGLADRADISARQVGLVVEAKHIDRNASRVGAQANAVKLSRRPIGVGDGVG